MTNVGRFTDDQGLKEPYLAETMPLTDELCAKVARFNGFLSPVEVAAALESGAAVWTHFNRYQRV